MRVHAILATATASAALVASSAACAAPAKKPQFGDPIAVSDTITIDPMLDARLRWENVDQPTIGADAVTMRIRSGFEITDKPAHLSLLAEAEGTLALVDHYNAFAFPTTSSQRRTQYAVIGDPNNVELNRLQLQYKTKAVTLTAGRQLINLDDQRWVGAAAWRQNEQTFDAVRGELRAGLVTFDATYAISQRTVFGDDAAPRVAYDGKFTFLGAGAKLGPVQVKAFAYLLDYDTGAQGGTLATPNADTQSYGLRATTSLPLGKKVKLNLAASYARQSDWKDTPGRYTATYAAAEAGLAYQGWALTGGYELLGSALASNGVRRAVQTPMATLHKFNGWADLFLTTPANGIQDVYVGLAKAFPKVSAIKGLNLAVIYHDFSSDFGSQHYGHEWDASVGWKIRKVAFLAKFADYRARAFGTNTRKLWLEADYAF